MRSQSDGGQEGLALSLHSNSSQRCSIRLRSGLCAGQSSSSTPNSLIMSLWTLLCALVHSHVGTGRGHPQTVPTKLGAWNCPTSLGVLKHSKFLSLELRGQAQVLEKQPHAIIPPPPNFTQRSQARTVLLATTKPRLVHQSARWRSSIRQSREHVSTALESSGCVLYTTASNALHCTCWCMVWMQLLSHGNPFHEALYALF